MMMSISLIEDLQQRYPEEFEGWDEFEASIQVRQRKNKIAEALVLLYNESKEKGCVVDLHRSFTLGCDENGKDIIRVGGSELVQEYHNAYIK